MIEREILEVLQKATTQAVAQSIMPTLPVGYVSTVKPTPNDQKWLEVIHLPNNRQGDFWGDERNHRGMFRLVLHWPTNNTGAYAPIDVIESIGKHFTKGLMLNSGVKITEQPDFMGVMSEGKEQLLPMSLRYACFKA